MSLPDAMEPLVDYYRSTAGEHPDWDDYRAAMERDRRVIVRIALDARRSGPLRVTDDVAAARSRRRPAAGGAAPRR